MSNAPSLAHHVFVEAAKAQPPLVDFIVTQPIYQFQDGAKVDMNRRRVLVPGYPAGGAERFRFVKCSLPSHRRASLLNPLSQIKNTTADIEHEPRQFGVPADLLRIVQHNRLGVRPVNVDLAQEGVD